MISYEDRVFPQTSFSGVSTVSFWGMTIPTESGGMTSGISVGKHPEKITESCSVNSASGGSNISFRKRESVPGGSAGPRLRPAALLIVLDILLKCQASLLNPWSLTDPAGCGSGWALFCRLGTLHESKLSRLVISGHGAGDVWLYPHGHGVRLAAGECRLRLVRRHLDGDFYLRRRRPVFGGGAAGRPGGAAGGGDSDFFAELAPHLLWPVPHASF